MANQNVQNYEHQIAELQKAVVFSQIEKRRSMSSLRVNDEPSSEAVDAGNNDAAMVTQLWEENEELKHRVSDLCREVEELRADKMERMESSFSSPLRMSLGTAFERLYLEQEHAEGNTSVVNRFLDHSFTSTPALSRTLFRSALNPSNRRSDAPSMEDSTLQEGSRDLEVGTESGEQRRRQVAMQLGAFILGSISYYFRG